jgi:tRNA uridine 5-carboxymethylaminomethyl modification enzyme
MFPEKVTDYGTEINTSIEIDLKYAGYIEREKKEVEKLSALDSITIPKTFNYDHVVGLRNEAREKLKKQKPHHLGQAARISGVSPADISVLMVSLKK